MYSPDISPAADCIFMEFQWDFCRWHDFMYYLITFIISFAIILHAFSYTTGQSEWLLVPTGAYLFCLFSSMEFYFNGDAKSISLTSWCVRLKRDEKPKWCGSLAFTALENPPVRACWWGVCWWRVCWWQTLKHNQDETVIRTLNHWLLASIETYLRDARAPCSTMVDCP